MIFRIYLKLCILFRKWQLNYRLKHHAVHIPKDYKTISQAVDAGETVIIIDPESKK